MEDIELKISQYIDSELPEEEQKKIFEQLATDKELRKFFSDQVILRNNLKRYYSALEFHDEKSSVTSNLSSTKFKYAFYLSAAAAAILFFSTIFSFFNQKGTDKYQHIREELSKLHSIAGNNSTAGTNLDFEFYSLNKKIEILEEEFKWDPNNTNQLSNGEK